MTPTREAWALLAWGALLVMPACAQSPAPPAAGGAIAQTTTPANGQSGGCNAAPAQFAVGQRGNDSLAEQARQRAGARSVRVIAHDEMVTKEFNNTRLNLELNEQRLVARVYCG